VQNVWARAFSYFRRFGARRSAMLLKKKFTGRVPWNIRGPSIQSTRYVKDHTLAAERSRTAPGQVKGSLPSPGTRLFGTASIALIADLNLPQCKKYRVMQKVEALRDMGLQAHHSHWQDVPRSVNLMQTATHVIFYRVTGTDLFQSYLGEARRLGLGTSYDIDDPVFDEAVYGANRNLAFLPAAERRHLLSQCGEYLAAMRACDNTIVSTPGLRSLAEARTGKPCYLWRNAVDAETLHAAKLALRDQERQTGKSGVVIGYASGSRAHGADFTVAEDAIIELLKRIANVTLTIAGHHEVSPKLAAFAQRTRIVPFTDYESYISTVAGFDINLVPLLQDSFNDCKSAIRFLDGAAVGVPTIASRIGDFVNVIDHGKTGLLADGEGSWLPHLERLAGDAALRRKMGEAARRFALTSQTAVAAARQADAALLSQFGAVEQAA